MRTHSDTASPRLYMTLSALQTLALCEVVLEAAPATRRGKRRSILATVDLSRILSSSSRIVVTSLSTSSSERCGGLRPTKQGKKLKFRQKYKVTAQMLASASLSNGS
ncbi:uncharacterized protein B0I36DRAFT_338608 [Microdochium trichocladiopsis]|uniref:Secreted protein n=1 Tax=Microdochium trichocladiopsis TaxID=1682393 RepID=A0A9P8XU35_9PEZI|nr:uncharacterized protein B0I36DRAFT_338608 [Microdochium trichocladiopsis]KAH7014359.1 hypothetical protein B0I36DRAFT_338608 [Microdochium trichocladiopsis]